MAHQILPQHRPHEQLRTEAPKQKPHSDKYVSAYVSSESFVEMSFSNPVLSESADHFKVGIDELSVNLSHLSMLEHDTSDVLFRIRRLGYFGSVINGGTTAQVAGMRDIVWNNAPIHAGTVDVTNNYGLPTAELKNAVEFKIDRRFNTLSEILERAKEITQALDTYIRDGGLINPDPNNYDAAYEGTYAKWNVPINLNEAQDAAEKFIDVDLTCGGLLKFTGNKVFWSNFVIEIPNPKYRYLLTGDINIHFISVNPITGGIHDAYGDLLGMVGMVPTHFYPVLPFANWLATNKAGWIDYTVELDIQLRFTGAMNVANSLDRRVALEVGCSLPIKNSPMVDHGQEAPDFVLGRYRLDVSKYATCNIAEGKISVNVNIGAQQLQGPFHRIVYHHLGPQQKIQLLRLRLWARVRTYDAVAQKWGMKTIQFPTEASDYWHVRLHFKPK